MSNLRIGGLASGIDTDEMVKKLMQAQRIPLDKLAQKKQLLEWKRDDYRALNNKILEFRNAAFDMKLSSNYYARTASVNGTGLTAAASANANEGVYTVEVNELASSASLITEDLAGAPGADKTLGFAPGTYDLKIEGPANSGAPITVQISDTDKVSDIVGKINARASETGVKVTYDEKADRLFFVATRTGAHEIRLEMAAEADLQKLGLQPDTDGGHVATARGTNAEIKFNGATLTYESNTVSVAGINLVLTQKGGTSTVTVAADVNAVYNNIKAFVDKYNELIEIVNKEIGEKRYRDFQPLTEEQKAEMKEDEIKRWEEKARSGMLAGDQVLGSGLIAFRNALMDSVSGLLGGQIKSLNEIGISTARGTYLDNGKLYIDEAKLKKAIAEKPDEVYKLFTASDGDDKRSTSGDGIAVRLYDKASALFKQITEKAGAAGAIEQNYEIGKSLLQVDEDYARLSRRLQEIETRYYNQFAAMESYINRMNAQSAWLMQQFGGGS